MQALQTSLVQNPRRRLQNLSQAEMLRLSSDYKCRIARGRASEEDYHNFLLCQRELSRRLA